MKVILVILALGIILAVSGCTSCYENETDCSCDQRGGSFEYNCKNDENQGCGGQQGCACDSAAKKTADSEDARTRCESRTAGTPDADPVVNSGTTGSGGSDGNDDDQDDDDNEEEEDDLPPPTPSTDGATQIV